MRGNFGFIHEKIEIKILVLFIMRRLHEPVTFDILIGLAMCDEGIGYFDLTECIAELVETDHLLIEDGRYSVTRKGVRNGEITESSLPYSVRVKAETGTAEVRRIQNRNALIKTFSKSGPEGGYTVNLSFSDGVGDIVSMELYAANEKQALALEKGFRKNAESIYSALIEMMLN